MTDIIINEELKSKIARYERAYYSSIKIEYTTEKLVMYIKRHNASSASERLEEFYFLTQECLNNFLTEGVDEILQKRDEEKKIKDACKMRENIINRCEYFMLLIDDIDKVKEQGWYEDGDRMYNRKIMVRLLSKALPSLKESIAAIEEFINE